jgi:hypothetical protein
MSRELEANERVSQPAFLSQVAGKNSAKREIKDDILER